MNPSTANRSEDEAQEPQFPIVDPLDRRPRLRPWIMFVVVAGLLLVSGAWLYILFGYKPELMIDEIADKTFPRQAEQICSVSKAELEKLPFASQARTASERADVVERSNEILTAMVNDIEPLAPTEPAAVNEAVNEWLGDWRTYIGDREAYVSNLRTDPKARFLETAKGGPSKGITRAITAFAQVNRMDSCATPADLS